MPISRLRSANDAGGSMLVIALTFSGSFHTLLSDDVTRVANRADSILYFVDVEANIAFQVYYFLLYSL